ncbi:hypothetical protein VKT23_012834 [Stygiomarasmius scandens]|uniref:Uncharacterized protein n=1 Tax=Marasmiellus scandens TaxID=2682957 RepID=A0ABR1J544_9AGAR
MTLGTIETTAIVFSGDGCSLAVVSRHNTFWNVKATRPRFLRSLTSLSSPALAIIGVKLDAPITGHARGEIRLITPYGDRKNSILRNCDNNSIESLALKDDKLLAVKTTTQIELYEVSVSSGSARFIGVISTPTSSVDETVPESMYWADNGNSVN